MTKEKTLSPESIQATIVSYILENHINKYTMETLPLDQSLFELDILDSMGIIELIAFIETNWSIVIEDTEITTEELGSIRKMVALISRKISLKR
jgi:acyl carrier protein